MFVRDSTVYCTYFSDCFIELSAFRDNINSYFNNSRIKLKINPSFVHSTDKKNLLKEVKASNKKTTPCR